MEIESDVEITVDFSSGWSLKDRVFLVLEILSGGSHSFEGYDVIRHESDGY